MLALTVFLVGIDENICIGILPAISQGLGVSMASAGQLTTIFSAVFALWAFTMAAWLSRHARRPALIVALLVFTLSNLAAAAAPGYAALFVARMAMAASCATIVLLCSRLATEITPPEFHGRAVGIIFMGISGSLVLGVPLGMTLEHWAGWRAVFAVIGLVSAPLMLVLWRALPLTQPATAPTLRAYVKALAQPRLLAAQGVSIAMLGGHFTLFAYLAPYLQKTLAPSPDGLSLLFVAFGVAGVAGAWLGGLGSDRAGASRALLGCPLLFLVAMAGVPLAAMGVTGVDSAWPVAIFVVAMMVWGCLSWSISPVVQNFLIRSAPQQADANVGVNVAAMHVGVALGAGAGGALVDANALMLTPWAGCALVAVAVALAAFAVRARR
ncbi:MFS transporter [Pandoraea norimbergensis]|uniref:MFS transporter n=1 Tax=Pandoraea norimbergensis TaxID=93219 RepID=A0ABM5WRB3_9BURK|nr:MFS transporter [Pandoraea norimbergensis]ALS63231.1 MFS transporter [Pandoraea norimbergensis]